MYNDLKILVLYDIESDFGLIKYEIEKHFPRVQIETASNRKGFIIKLSNFKPDVVISDYHLPDFDGLTALSITHEMYPDLPFIITTSSASEEFGILCIKNGAYDYILKNHLKKLPIVIEKALKKYELILENKRAYEELKESEKKFRRLAENAQDIIYRYEFFPKKGFAYLSPSVIEITGYTPEEHYNNPYLGFDIIHPEDRHILKKIFKEEKVGEEPITLKSIKKDGSIIYLELKNIPIYDNKGNLVAIEGIARDVTERKKLEETLKENELRFRMISTLITDYAYSFIVDENLDLKGEWISESFTRVFGYTLKEIDEIGGWQNCFYKEDLSLVLEHVKKIINGSPDRIECRMVTKYGDIRWIRDYAVPIFDNSKKRVIKIFGVSEDITQHKKLEQEIKYKEEQFENLANTTTTAIFIYQGENFVYVNKAGEKLSGYSIDELLKMKFYDLVHPDFTELVKERGLKRQLGETVPSNYEIKIITKDGKEKWIDFTGSFIHWFGKPAGIGTAYDITPLKNAIEELGKSTERYRTLIENAPIGIIVEDADGTILSFNRMYEKITGYNKSDLIGKNIRILASPKNLHMVDENIRRILDGQILDHIVESFKKDGNKIFVHLIETRIFLPEGRYGILSFCEDLTEKVILHNQLIESQKKFKTIFDTANEGICIVDDKEIITDANEQFCKILGYDISDVIGVNFDERFVHPDERTNALLEKTKRINGHSGVFERRLIKKDGKVIWVKVSARGIFNEQGQYTGSFAFITDITEQKKLQEELKKSEEQFRLIWENSNDGMRLTDEDGNVILVNKAFCDLIGLSKDQIKGKTMADIYLPENREMILKKHKERFKSGNIKTHFESCVTLYNGNKIWFEVTNSFIQINDKKYLLGIFRDITERKKLQQELINSEKQFRMIWEESNDCMLLVDKRAKIKLVNPALCNLVGLKQSELINKSLDIIFSEEFRDDLLKIHLSKLSTGHFNTKFEGGTKLQNGKEIYFEATFSNLNIMGEELYLAIIRDITERKKLIDELIRAKDEAEEANRLKSGFISMMSHEIRTPLNVILGFTNVLKEIFLNKEEDEEIPNYFVAIEKAGKRLLNTITQILDISRIEAGEFEIHLKEINLNEKVLDAIQQIKILADAKNITFDISLDSKNPVLMLDEYCIDGILINLINNAVKFSKENSKIDVVTEMGDKKIIFRIRDYGIGMSEEYRKHLFQPFSQEEVGYGRSYEGTGLGLALTKKFIDLLNGKINVWSEKDKGTQFEVIFPLLEQNNT